MKTFRAALALVLLAAAGSASAQINLPAPDTPGSSREYAVRLIATNDLMVDRQISRWLRTHYPGWDAEPAEYQEFAGERFAIVYITSANNPGRRVYFRIQRSAADPDDSGNPFPL